MDVDLTRGAALLAALLAAVAPLGCARACSTCDDTDAFTSVAPDGQHRVVARYRGCGAAVGETLHVSVVEGGRAPPADGNAVVLDCRTDRCDATTVRVAWASSRTATLYFPDGAHLVAPQSAVGDVRLYYVTRSQEAEARSAAPAPTLRPEPPRPFPTAPPSGTPTALPSGFPAAPSRD